MDRFKPESSVHEWALSVAAAAGLTIESITDGVITFAPAVRNIVMDL